MRCKQSHGNSSSRLSPPLFSKHANIYQLQSTAPFSVSKQVDPVNGKVIANDFCADVVRRQFSIWSDSFSLLSRLLAQLLIARMVKLRVALYLWELSLWPLALKAEERRSLIQIRATAVPLVLLCLTVEESKLPILPIFKLFYGYMHKKKHRHCSVAPEQNYEYCMSGVHTSWKKELNKIILFYMQTHTQMFAKCAAKCCTSAVNKATIISRLKRGSSGGKLHTKLELTIQRL